jgi:outer membrane protein
MNISTKLRFVIKKSMLAIALTGLFLSSKVYADQPPAAINNIISIVDTQVILEKSTAIQKVKDQLDKKAEEFKTESSSKEAYFKKKYEDLEKQKSVLSKEAFEQKNNDLAKEFSDTQKKIQENRNSLDKAYMEAMQEFEKTLTDIVKQEASKLGSKVALPKAQTLYSDSSLDITNNVLDILNKKLPIISVKF